MLRAFRNHRYVLPDAPALTRRPSDRKPTASTAARRLRSGGVYSAGRAARRLTQPGHSSQRRRNPGTPTRLSPAALPLPPAASHPGRTRQLSRREDAAAAALCLAQAGAARPGAPQPAQGRLPPPVPRAARPPPAASRGAAPLPRGPAGARRGSGGAGRAGQGKRRPLGRTWWFSPAPGAGGP